MNISFVSLYQCLLFHLGLCVSFYSPLQSCCFSPLISSLTPVLPNSATYSPSRCSFSPTFLIPSKICRYFCLLFASSLPSGLHSFSPCYSPFLPTLWHPRWLFFLPLLLSPFGFFLCQHHDALKSMVPCFILSTSDVPHHRSSPPPPGQLSLCCFPIPGDLAFSFTSLFYSPATFKA